MHDLASNQMETAVTLAVNPTGASRACMAGGLSSPLAVLFGKAAVLSEKAAGLFGEAATLCGAALQRLARALCPCRNAPRRRQGLRDMAARMLCPALLLLYGAGACGEEPHARVGVTQSGEVFTVEATVDAPVTQKTAWGVLVDFDHMASILPSLTSSKIVSREGNILVVKQEGVARFGLLSFPFESERRIRLEPMSQIQAKDLSGTVKRMESEMQVSAASQGKGVQIKYHAEIVPDSMLAHLFGASVLRSQITDQFESLVAEMERREKN